MTYLRELVPIPQPHCQQITGVSWATSWGRGVRNGIFHDSLFPIQTVWTDNVPYAKPVSFALLPVDRSYRQSNLLRAICPPAQLLSPVLVNNVELIFIPVIVRHVLSP
jgi:hypothetical protein